MIPTARVVDERDVPADLASAFSGSVPSLQKPSAFRGFVGRGAIFNRAWMTRVDADALPYSVVVVTGRTVAGDSISGAGIDLDPAAARRSAFAEGIERYCLRTIPPALERSSRRELHGEALSAAEWPLFTAEQLAGPSFPYSNMADGEVYAWSRGHRLGDGCEVRVPTCLVYVGVKAHGFTAGVSTGAAAHRTAASALLSGLYEVIERDALTIVWEARATVPRIDPEAATQTEEVRRLAAALRQSGLRLLLRDMTTDLGVPCVLGIITDPRGGRPAMAIGAAARLDPLEACRRAARETYFSWCWMRDEHRQRPVTLAQATAAAEVPREMMWQAYLYGFPELLEKAAHLLAETALGDMPLPFTLTRDDLAPAAELDLVCRQLAVLGYQPIGFNLTAPELKALDLHVHKVVVPGLTPMSLGRWCRALAHPRIEQVPERLGWPHLKPLSPGAASPLPLP